MSPSLTIVADNVSKACIIETIWNCRQNMKTGKQGRLRMQYDTLSYDMLTCRENFESNEAKWCILTLLCSTTFRGSDSATHPLPLHFLLQIWTFYYLLFWDEVYLSVDIAIHIWLSIYCSIVHSKSQLLPLYKPYFALDHFIGVNVVFEIIY